MKGRRHTPEQVVRKLHEADKLVGQGKDLAAVLKHLEVSEQTYYRWRKRYGELSPDDAKRLRELEAENRRLKKLVAEQALDIDMLKEIEPGKLLSPERRRHAVAMCQRRFGASERRACRVVGQARSTQRRPSPVRPPAEARLRARLREVSRAHPRWGYRRVRIELTKEGWSVNAKKVHRLWRDEELQVRPRRRKRHRGTSTIDEVLAGRPNEVWALDFQFDATADGRQLKLLHGVDEFTREAIVMRVGRSCDADEVVAQLEEVMTTRGAPGYLRCDNGPEFIAAALGDWCRFSGAGTVFIEPGSPWQNPYVESFNARVPGHELLNTTEFYTLAEATVLVADFQMDYNWLRPHSSLQDLAPSVFAERWSMDHQPARLL